MLFIQPKQIFITTTTNTFLISEIIIKLKFLSLRRLVTGCLDDKEEVPDLKELFCKKYVKRINKLALPPSLILPSFNLQITVLLFLPICVNIIML